MKAYVCKCLCVFWVEEVLFLCFLGWENGNNGRIVLRVGKDDEVGGREVEGEGERGGEDRRRQEKRAQEKGDERGGYMRIEGRRGGEERSVERRKM